jgi:hypothetical protein
MAGIGFTLPYLPLYLRGEGFSDRAISFTSALAALVGVAQFPLGLWSDKLGRRKPFLVALLALLAVATALLPLTHGLLLVGLLVLLFAENGVCRATVESLAGAEATQLAPPDGVGAALGALRVWRPIVIVVVALASIGLSGVLGVRELLVPLAVVQGMAVVLALLIREDHGKYHTVPVPSPEGRETLAAGSKGLRDVTLWVFVVAMVLFHFANAPGGVYLGLFMKQDLGASEGLLPVAFVISHENVRVKHGGTHTSSVNWGYWADQVPKYLTIEGYKDEHVILDGSATIPAEKWERLKGCKCTYCAAFVSQSWRASTAPSCDGTPSSRTAAGSCSAPITPTRRLRITASTTAAAGCLSAHQTRNTRSPRPT